MNYSLKDAYNFLVKGNLKKAKKITEYYLIKNPKDLNALQILSAVFFQSKDFENAKIVLERLIEINPSNAQIHNNYALAVVCALQGKVSKNKSAIFNLYK